MYSPKSLIAKKEAAIKVGDQIIDSVLSENCEPTSRLIDDCFDAVEYMSSYSDGVKTVRAYYYITKNEYAEGSLDDIDWDDKLSGFEIEHNE